MDKISWNKFNKAKEKFKQEAERLSKALPGLKKIQQEFVNNRSEVSYKIETPVVYNSALDDFTAEDEIKLILVADNPGRREQAAENRRYLVGPSGKIAHKFFRENPALGIDYLKNVIILNKTPIHTPRTVDLKELLKEDLTHAKTCMRAGEHVNLKMQNSENPNKSNIIHSSFRAKHQEHKEHKGLIFELEKSQKFMADLLLEFYKAFECPVWIIGYSEMKKKGIFEVYTERLKELCSKDKDFYKQLYFYRHFSMNQFTIDLNKQTQDGESVSKALKRIGKVYRERILG